MVKFWNEVQNLEVIKHEELSWWRCQRQGLQRIQKCSLLWSGKFSGNIRSIRISKKMKRYMKNPLFVFVMVMWLPDFPSNPSLVFRLFHRRPYHIDFSCLTAEHDIFLQKERIRPATLPDQCKGSNWDLLENQLFFCLFFFKKSPLQWEWLFIPENSIKDFVMLGAKLRPLNI